MDGLEIIRSVRQWTKTPIIVVSARSREQEKVDALDAGADDYVTKPFGTAELLARIRTALRRAEGAGAGARPAASWKTAAYASITIPGGCWWTATRCT